MGRRSQREFWRASHDLEALAQLKADLHGALGRLLTRCCDLAKLDPTCADYWQGEAIYWDGQYREAVALVDKMIQLASAEHGSVRAAVGGRTIEIGTVNGDVIVSQIGDNVHDVAVGKDLRQTVEEEDQ